MICQRLQHPIASSSASAPDTDHFEMIIASRRTPNDINLRVERRRMFVCLAPRARMDGRRFGVGGASRCTALMQVRKVNGPDRGSRRLGIFSGRRWCFATATTQEAGRRRTGMGWFQAVACRCEIVRSRPWETVLPASKTVAPRSRRSHRESSLDAEMRGRQRL